MRNWFLGVTAVVLSANLSFAQADPKAVLEKAIKAHGGKDLLTKYPASKVAMTGELALMGMNIEIEGNVVGAPGKLKTALTMTVQGQKIEVLQVTDGKKVKSEIKAGGMNINQELTDTQKEEILFSAQTREMSHLVPLLDAKKYELKSEADEEVEKKKVDVISIKIIEGQRTMKFYFDKESNLLVKSSHEGLLPGSKEDKKGSRVSLFSDYKKIDGLMQPMKIVAFAEDTVYLTAKITEYTNLEKVDDKEFAIED